MHDLIYDVSNICHKLGHTYSLLNVREW